MLSQEMLNSAYNEAEDLEPPQQELDVFKHNVRNWIRMDDEVRKISEEAKALQKRIKERKAHRDTLNNAILAFMQKYKIGDLNTSTGKISRTVSTTKEQLNVKKLKDKLNKFNEGDEAKTEILLKFLDENRDKKETVKLKRTVAKQTMNI